MKYLTLNRVIKTELMLFKFFLKKITKQLGYRNEYLFMFEIIYLIKCFEYLKI